MAHIRRGADLLTGVRLLGLKAQEIEDLQINLLFPYMQGLLDGEIEAAKHPDAARALAAAQKERVFHWEFAFPEVFEQGGFSAFVGNPPFMGGRKISETYGTQYREVIDYYFQGAKGNADYCAFFFSQAFSLLRQKGTLGLIATNTISQGDTRVTGIDRICKLGGKIYQANVDIPWMGHAMVTVDIVYIIKGNYSPPLYLNNLGVDYISTHLDDQESLGDPKLLTSNESICFQGSLLRGTGFIISTENASNLIQKDEQNKKVVRKYLNGEDVTQSPDHSTNRWVINFYDWNLEKAKKFELPMQVLMEHVYPERMGTSENIAIYNKMWWQFWRPRSELYKTIADKSKILVIAEVSKYVSFALLDNDFVYSHMLDVFNFDSWGSFALLQSNFHVEWVMKYSSTLGKGIRYVPRDCFINFPFPQNLPGLEQIGETYHETRRQVMLARQEGLTKTYNRFHDPGEHAADIQGLRELHVQMDSAVAAAYGWEDLALGHGFHETAQGVRYTISESARREVLSRLLKLNHERWEEEQLQGTGEVKVKKGAKKKNAKARSDGQLGLI